MQIQEELERLNNEASARAKRERRKANEKKTRTIQRMQLQMTAPMDIGQEFEDAGLQTGQADIFDLTTADRRRKTLLAAQDLSSSEDEEDGKVTMNGGEANSDSEAEGGRVDALEDEMDALYEDYKAKLSEKDAKFRAKEARKQNKDRDETWKGIQEERSSDDSDSDAESESEVGGWEEMQDIKRHVDSDGNSSSSESDISSSKQRKRKRSQPPNGTDNVEGAVDRKRKKGNNGLVVKLNDSNAGGPSKTSQLWFSQDIFANLGDHVVQELGSSSASSSASQNDASEVSGNPTLLWTLTKIACLQGRIR